MTNINLILPGDAGIVGLEVPQIPAKGDAVFLGDRRYVVTRTTYLAMQASANFYKTVTVNVHLRAE